MAEEQLHPAYLLHARPYRNTSLLATFFTAQYGRIDAVVRNARGQRSRIKGLLQLFTPLVIGWTERQQRHSHLINVKTIEAQRFANPLPHANLTCGFYMNELLVRLLHTQEDCKTLFQVYELLLTQLRKNQPSEALLRRFENQLLITLGYGLQLTHDAQTNEPIATEKLYEFIPDRGPIALTTQQKKTYYFSGASFIALTQGHYPTDKSQQEAKRIMRLAINYWLNGKPINKLINRT